MARKKVTHKKANIKPYSKRRYIFLKTIPDGWKPIVAELIESLTAKKSYIKNAYEKYGKLYIEYHSTINAINASNSKTKQERRIRDIETLIYEASKKALNVCQTCGNLGELYQTKTGKYKTVCEQHKESNVF